MDNGHMKSENLNQDDWRRSLEISAPASMPTPEALQEKANDFFTPENTVGNFPNDLEQAATDDQATTESRPLEVPSQPGGLGQITTITTPNIAPAPDSRNFNTVNIKTTGDRLEKTTIPEIDNAIEELNQTGNLNNFYDEIRGEGSMLDANLSNSFNRKLGDNQLSGGGN